MSRWHSTTINFQTPATDYHLEIIRHPDEEGQDCISGEAARVRVYRYAPTGILQTEATGGTRANGPGMLETRNEVVTFQWGWGDIGKWNQLGQKRIYSGALLRRESAVRNHQYKIPFQDVTIRRDTPGDVTLRAWFGDTASPEIEAEITLNFLDPADPEAEPPTGEAPMIQAVRTDSGPIHPGVAHTVRVYHWHPDSTALSRWQMSGVSVVAGMTGMDSITETVEFRSGVGSISIFDTSGIRERIRDDLAGERIAYADVTYSAPYQDFSVTGAAIDTPYAVVWYWDSGEEATYQFQAVPEPPEEYPDQATCEAAGYYWWGGACHQEPEPVGGAVDVTLRAVNYYTGAAIAGAALTLDGSPAGTADAEGYITLTGMIPGASHTVKWTHSSIIDSDLDTLENDSFAVPG